MTGALKLVGPRKHRKGLGIYTHVHIWLQWPQINVSPWFFPYAKDEEEVTESKGKTTTTKTNIKI